MVRYIVISLLICLSFSKAHARELSIAMGSIEPYFIEKEQSGIFTDLINAVFKRMPDYEPKYWFGLTNNIRWNLYDREKIDSVANIFDSVPTKGCRTDPLFRFSDVAITRKDQALKLTAVSDLKGKSIVSFEGAKGFFGEEYTNSVSSDAYFEIKNQPSQAKMLAAGRVDVSVGDLFIFLNALQLPQNTTLSMDMFDVHHIFPKISTRMAFRDEGICPLFNAALAEIKNNGEYEKIYDRYLTRFNYTKP
jgi:polar amino acid transport system substrate-binding protein